MASTFAYTWCASRSQRLGTANLGSFIYIFTALEGILSGDGYVIFIAVSCKYGGAQMYDKWQKSDPKCLFVVFDFSALPL